MVYTGITDHARLRLMQRSRLPLHVLLVTLDDNQKWYNHENGREMFMSEGDMVLKAWALDDASNLLAKTVDPSQLVDIIQKNEIQQRFLADLDI